MYNEGSFSFSDSYIYIALINNISISISMYCLALFYLGFEDDLQPFRPFLKFLCIKFVLFFSYWQTIAFQLCFQLKIIELEDAKLFQSLLMCFEMMLASIAHSFAFSHSDFVDYSRNNHEFISNLKSVMNVVDIIEDAESTFTNNDSEDKPLCDMNGK